MSREFLIARGDTAEWFELIKEKCCAQNTALVLSNRVGSMLSRSEEP